MEGNQVHLNVDIAVSDWGDWRKNRQVLAVKLRNVVRSLEESEQPMSNGAVNNAFGYAAYRLNTVHGSAGAIIVGSPLSVMFDLQKAFLQRLFGLDLPSEDGVLTDRIPMTVTSIVAELGEILENVQGWKDWRKNPPDVDVANLRMEVSDLFHFFINLALFCGVDEHTLFSEFLKKNGENHARQDRGY